MRSQPRWADRMRPESLAVLACPSCLGPLFLPSDGPNSWPEAALECGNEKLRFPVIEGIPQLVRPARVNAVRKMAEEYSRVWQADGWGCSSPSYLLNLPNRDTTGRQT